MCRGPSCPPKSKTDIYMSYLRCHRTERELLTSLCLLPPTASLRMPKYKVTPKYRLLPWTITWHGLTRHHQGFSQIHSYGHDIEVSEQFTENIGNTSMCTEYYSTMCELTKTVHSSYCIEDRSTALRWETIRYLGKNTSNFWTVMNGPSWPSLFPEQYSMTVGYICIMWSTVQQQMTSSLYEVRWGCINTTFSVRNLSIKTLICVVL